MAIGTPTLLGTDTDPGGTGEINITTSGAAPSGSKLILAGVWRQNTAGTLTTVTAGGLTWVQDFIFTGDAAGDPCIIEFWSADAPSGLASSTALKWDISGGATPWGINGALMYVTGLATSSYKDGAGSSSFNGSGASTWSAGSFSTTNADDLMVAAAFGDGPDVGGMAETTDGGYTEVADWYDSTNQWTSGLYAKVVSATGSKSAGGTITNTADFGQFGALAAYKAAAGGAQSIAVGLITETDTAQAMGKAKAKAVGLVTSTETAQPIARSKARAVGLVTETQAAQPFGKAKVKAIGLATSTEIALPITRTKSRTLGLVTSTESAFSIAKSKAKAAGIATETDQALPIAAPAAAGTSHDLSLKHAGT